MQALCSLLLKGGPLRGCSLVLQQAHPYQVMMRREHHQSDVEVGVGELGKVVLLFPPPRDTEMGDVERQGEVSDIYYYHHEELILV